MNRYCLDTSAYSHFKRGHPPVVDVIDRADWIGVPSIVVGELWVGFLLGERPERSPRPARPLAPASAITAPTSLAAGPAPALRG
jgi:predicted nucleic acid-binding protein